MRIKFYAFYIFAFLFLCVTKAFSQEETWGTLTEHPNTAIDSSINGYIEILPPGYNASTAQKYPLLIFLEGQSQLGNGSPTQLDKLYGTTGEGMLPRVALEGHFSNNYSLDGVNYSFIVLVPQVRAQVQKRPFDEAMLSPAEVDDIINYAFQHYRVDPTRVYLTGLSLGGGSTWNYVGEKVEYGNRVAAIIPFAGASDLSHKPERADNIAASNVPVWTFVTSSDDVYRPLAVEYIDAIANIPEHTEDEFITIYTRGQYDHNSWAQPVSEGSTENSDYATIYDWLLTKTRPSNTTPMFATVDAGTVSDLNLANGSMVLGPNEISFAGATVSLSGTATPPPSGIATIEWVRVDGNGGVIADPHSLTTQVTNLKPGDYTFQLRVTGNDGITAVDNVSFTVTKPTENNYYRIEAEDYSSLSGTQKEENYFDEGPAAGLGFWGSGHSATYDVNVEKPGSYDLYYRYTTYGAQPIQIIVNGTTYDASLSGVGAPNWTTSKISGVELGTTNEITFVSQGGNWLTLNYFELGLTAVDASLPVKFIYFNTQCNSGEVTVRWKTAQEENSSAFVVQRSTDGVDWADVGSVPAAGQSTSERSYVFVDRAAPATAYYRVQEQDADGRTSMTGTVKSICGAKTKLTLYPNPNNGHSVISLQVQEATQVNVQVVNAAGILVQQKQMQLPAGASIIPIDINSQPNGVYTIRVRYAGNDETLKMLKK